MQIGAEQVLCRKDEFRVQVTLDGLAEAEAAASVAASARLSSMAWLIRTSKGVVIRARGSLLISGFAPRSLRADNSPRNSIG